MPPPNSAAPPLATKHRGNPNLGLAPRCGARTRAGCPCRSPAIHGKTRCRMHGGRSTGPRTKQGLARVSSARTVHGQFGAEARARDRHILTLFRRGQVMLEAQRHATLLPPDLADRLSRMPPELMLPPRPSSGTNRKADRAASQAEAAALAPWKLAIAAARQARRDAAAAKLDPTGFAQKTAAKTPCT